jgi:long-chain fatty acid transport protein
MRAIRLAAIFVLAGAASAHAAGYALKEESTDAMGAAYAGSAATEKDASYLFYNPASLDGVENWDVSVSGIGIFIDSSAHYPISRTSAGTPTGGTQTPNSYISNALIPELGLRKRLSPRWSIGLVASAPWGLITHYPTNWAGRYYAEYTKLMTINATPTVAFEVTPQLSLGAGLQVEYAKGKLGSAIDIGSLGALAGIPGAIPGRQDGFAHLDGDGWATGFTLGAIGKPTSDLTLGLSYRSKIDHTLDGSLNFGLNNTGFVGPLIRSATGLFEDTQATAKLPMPDVVSFGGREAFSDDWAGLFEVDWTNWSLLRQLRIVAANPAQPPDVTNLNWHDAWFGSLGMEHRLDERWAFRFGTAFDESPTSDATREPRVPDADRIWLAAGASYRWNDSTEIELSAGHLFDVSGNVALYPSQPGNQYRGELIGITNSAINVVGLQLNYRD